MTDSTSPHDPVFSQIEATIKEVTEMSVTQNTLDGVTSRVLQALHPTANVQPVQNASTTRLRAIIAIALASLSVVAAIFLGSVPSSSVAFAQTQRQVEKTQTVQYVEYMHEADARREIDRSKSMLKNIDTELAAITKDKDRSADEIATQQDRVHGMKQEMIKNIQKLEAALHSGKPIKHRQVLILGRYLQRVEQDEAWGKRIDISNAQTGEEVLLELATKTFTRRKTQTVLGMKSGDKSVSSLKPRPEADFYAKFAAISTEKLAAIPEKQFDGVTVVGFQETEAFTYVMVVRTYWINKSTRLPVRIDAVATHEGAVVGGSSLANFVFDAPLDQALFSAEPPEGYTVQDGGFMSLDPAN